MPKIELPDGTSLVFNKAVIHIGRNPSCDVVLHESGVSRIHARIIVDRGEIILEDLDSKNGTWFKNKKISKIILTSGDIFYVDKTPIKIEILPEDDLLEPSIEIEDSNKFIATESDNLYKVDEINSSLLRSTEWRGKSPYENEKNSEKYPRLNEHLKELIDEDENNKPDENKSIGDFEKDIDNRKENLRMTIPTPPNEEEFREKIFEDLKAKADEDSQATKLLKDKNVPVLPTLNRITVLHPSTGEKIIRDLSVGVLTIGRDPKNDLVIDHPSVSAEHALLEISTDGTVQLKDLNSTNGTWVNGKSINSQFIVPGDKIEFGVVPAVFGDPSLIKSKSLKDSTFWKNLRIILLMIIIVLLLLYIFKRNGQSHKITVPSNKKIKNTHIPQEPNDKLVLYNLEQALSLKEAGELAKALQKLNIILDKLDPGNKRALELYNEIILLKEEREKKREEMIKRENKIKAKIKSLLKEAEFFIDKGDFKNARKKIFNAEKLGADKVKTISLLEKIDKKEKAIREKEKRTAAERKKLLGEIEKAKKLIANEEFTKAAVILKKINKCPYADISKKAASLLKTTDKKLSEITTALIADTKIMIDDGDIPDAVKKLKKILKIDPDNKEAKTLYRNLLKKQAEEAEKIFNEGRVYEYTLEDTEAALERYKEVLKMLPDPSHPLYKKAEKRIKALSK